MINPKQSLKKLGRRFLNYVLQGTLYVVPIAVTVYVIYFVFHFLDKTFSYLIPFLDIPGLGIVGLLLTLALVGYLGTNFISRRLIVAFARLLDKAPLVKVIYTSVSDLLSTFVDKKKNLGKPVLVLINKETRYYRPGFITQDKLDLLNLDDEYVAVYFPHSYNFSGELSIVHISNVVEVHPDLKAANLMKFVVSGGISKL